MFENLSFAAVMDNATRIQLLTATAAALAALAACISPLVSLFVTKRHIASATSIAEKQILSASQIAEKQIWAASVSAARREWNDQLRAAVGELISTAGNFAATLSEKTLSEEHDENLLEKADRFFDRSHYLLNSVHLYLRPEDPLQADLQKSVSKVLPSVHELWKALRGGDEKTFAEAEIMIGRVQGEVIAATRRVLDSKSERIKQDSKIEPLTEG